MPADERRRGRAAALVRHVGDRVGGHAHPVEHHHHRDVRERAHAAGRVGQLLARLELRLDVRQRVQVGLRVDGEDEGVLLEQAEERVVVPLVGDARVDGRHAGLRADAREQQRVAVRLGTHDEVRAGHPAGAGPVAGEHGMADVLRRHGRENPGLEVGGSARVVGDDELDGLAGIVGGDGRGAGEHGCGCGSDANRKAARQLLEHLHLHDSPLRVVLWRVAPFRVTPFG